MSELTRTPSCVVLVPRGFIPSALVCPSLCSSTILHILILNGLALSVHYHRLVTCFSQIFRLSTFFLWLLGSLEMMIYLRPLPHLLRYLQPDIGIKLRVTTWTTYPSAIWMWYSRQNRWGVRSTECRFDILFLSETRLDKFVSSTLLSNPHYRIIRRDRQRGAGGLLVYIRNSVVARRQPKMEQENIESICLNVKGIANTSFYVCACYRSPNLCRVSDFISACSTAADKMLKS